MRPISLRESLSVVTSNFNTTINASSTQSPHSSSSWRAKAHYMLYTMQQGYLHPFCHPWTSTLDPAPWSSLVVHSLLISATCMAGSELWIFLSSWKMSETSHFQTTQDQTNSFQSCKTHILDFELNSKLFQASLYNTYPLWISRHVLHRARTHHALGSRREQGPHTSSIEPCGIQVWKGQGRAFHVASIEWMELVKPGFTGAGACWQQPLLFTKFLVTVWIRDWIISFTMNQNTDLFNECKWSFVS